ncbi:MAG: SPFH domain-containing protein [Planctomycetes bacterium]|jgi:flotillin|nr:SPFH domain-containing protein [Planctomycetota bacterium]
MSALPFLAASSGQTVIVAMILLIAVAFVVVVWAMASRYKKIPPNQVGIFYGRKYKYIGADGRLQHRGFRVVAGGGALLWPVIEHFQPMSTSVTQVEIDEADIPNKDNVKISAKGVGTFKIETTEESLHNAAAAFLGKGDEELARIVRNILQGHLRSIIGKLNINEILRDRDAFNKKVVEESTEELKRLGIQIITLVIQEVTDEYGYIDALGKQSVAEAIRDANIKTAQAEAETKKKVSDANREADIQVASNAVQVAQAERDRDVKKAQFKTIADTEKAKGDQAFAIAMAEQEKTLKVRQAERDAAEKEAQIEVQAKEAARKEQELTATVVKIAEANRCKQVIEAEAAKQVAVTNAEAAKEAAIRRAEGEKQARVYEGEGEASKTKAVMLAQAEGEAAKTKQALVAEAEGEAAKKGLVLKAEAEGTKQLAEALAKMSADAKMILILDRLPMLLDRGGDAMSKVATSVFSSVAAPLGQIDEVRIIDVGGNGRGLDQFGSIVPNTVFKFLSALKVQGIDLKPLLGKLGISLDELEQLLTSQPPQTKPAAVKPVDVMKSPRPVIEESASPLDGQKA